MKTPIIVLSFFLPIACWSQKQKSYLPKELPPIPVTTQLREGSVSLGKLEDYPEIKLTELPSAPGPYLPTWESIEKNYPGEPKWLREAKFGIWVHFGPQAAGESGDWYARKLYVGGTTAHSNHLKNYGHPSEVGYKDILKDWNPQKLDPATLTKIYQDAGARFLVIQGVHHDNFDLWNSKYQPWNSTNIGPKSDLIGEWAKACRAQNMHFGITFHHEYTWWWWQTAFGSDKDGSKQGISYDGSLTLADGVGKWWEGYDPRLLYGVNLREYQGVAEVANGGWSPPPSGIFKNHIPYAKWYSTQWALRMMDAIDKYNPDFIYTDGTDQKPFSGSGTGTGIITDATQRVISYYYNQTLARRGKVDAFSVIKFRNKTNGTITTEEFRIPHDIRTDQPWIGEAPVGDWFYAPGFFYNSDMIIRYIIEAIARDGNAAISIAILPDGSLDEGTKVMLKGVGEWMRINGEAVYGSKAWKIPGEGEILDGKLKMIPGGSLGKRQAEYDFNQRDFRFTIGKNNSLYAFCMTVPEANSEVIIKSLGKETTYVSKPIKTVKLLGYTGKVKWHQDADGLKITCPEKMSFNTSLVFKVD